MYTTFTIDFFNRPISVTTMGEEERVSPFGEWMEQFRSLLEERGLCLGSDLGAMGKKGLLGRVYEGGDKVAEVDPRDYRSSNRKLSMFTSYTGFNFRVERVGQSKPRKARKGSPEEVLWYLRKCLLPVSVCFSSRATSQYQFVDSLRFLVGAQDVDLGSSLRKVLDDGIKEIIKSYYSTEANDPNEVTSETTNEVANRDVDLTSGAAWFRKKQPLGAEPLLNPELVVKILEYLLNMVEERLFSAGSVGGGGGSRLPFKVQCEYNSSYIQMGMDALGGVGDPDILRNKRAVERVVRRMRSCGDGNIWMRLDFFRKVNKTYGSRIEEVFGELGVVGYKEVSWGTFLFSVEEKIIEWRNLYFPAQSNSFEVVVEGKVGEYPAGLYLGSGISLEERYKMQERGKSPCLVEDPVFLSLLDVYRKMERRMSLSRAFSRVVFLMDL